MRSDASTEPPGESTRTTSAFKFLVARPSSSSLAMVSPPAVPAFASPSTIVPATVMTPTASPEVDTGFAANQLA